MSTSGGTATTPEFRQSGAYALQGPADIFLVTGLPVFPISGRCMISAYCKSSEADKVKKIEALSKLIPEEEYRAWLNVLFIKLYVQEKWLEEMENAINEAFEHGMPVKTTGIMKCIIATYFWCDAVEKPENFVRRAEFAGWRVCLSLYHLAMDPWLRKHWDKCSSMVMKFPWRHFHHKIHSLRVASRTFSGFSHTLKKLNHNQIGELLL
ncbi:hypothetical protein RJT34_20200 [Clitoria ternatea]|uniref:Uncharacterized protein n=1 Tax=Clitoria ternatea TaxID=43366 RepID=A0AAN9ISE4_CLITE